MELRHESWSERRISVQVQKKVYELKTNQREKERRTKAPKRGSPFFFNARAVGPRTSSSTSLHLRLHVAMIPCRPEMP